MLARTGKTRKNLDLLQVDASELMEFVASPDFFTNSIFLSAPNINLGIYFLIFVLHQKKKGHKNKLKTIKTLISSECVFRKCSQVKCLQPLCVEMNRLSPENV